MVVQTNGGKPRDLSDAGVRDLQAALKWKLEKSGTIKLTTTSIRPNFVSANWKRAASWSYSRTLHNFAAAFLCRIS